MARFGTFNDPQDLEIQLETVLTSNASGSFLIGESHPSAEEVQETLLGILGFDDMDFVQDLLTHRDDIIHAMVIASNSVINYRRMAILHLIRMVRTV